MIKSLLLGGLTGLALGLIVYAVITIAEGNPTAGTNACLASGAALLCIRAFIMKNKPAPGE